MSISIPTEFGTFLDDMIAPGAYPSREAVISDALRQLRERRLRLEELKMSLREAQEEVARGEVEEFDVEEILAEGRRMYTARHPE
ncbi:MAG: type II toxin-antitoxin system ParD family antitoxin [Pirellulaceae bacterium]